MKKFTLYFLFAASMLVHINLSSQTQDSIQLLYSSLPDTLFPRGFLHDQSALRELFHGTDYDLHSFNGSIPGKVITKRHGEVAYNDLFLSQRLTNGLLFGNKTLHLKPWPTFESQSKADSVGLDVSLYLNWFKVHELDSNAFTTGRLHFDGEKVTTVPLKMWLDSAHRVSWSTPAPLDSAFKAVKEFSVFFGGTNSAAQYISGQQTTVSFSLLDHLVQSNQQLPSHFYIDLDDGQGFRKSTMNQKLTATYTSASGHAELIHKDLAIRIRDAGQWLETRFRISLIFNVDEPDTVLYTRYMPAPPCFSIYEPKEEASMSIKYAQKGLGLQKPVVIVEGFESALPPYGLINYQGVSSGVILNENDERVHLGMEKLSWLYDSLHTAGYDIIHVDFEESKQSIEDNMQSLIKVLHWVNEQNADYPAIVVGASMGGLVVRAALLELERKTCFLNISAYGTFDTPHDGAFIPLGIQMGAKRIEELTTVLWHWSLVETWTKALNSPTARQMLIDHLDSTAKFDRARLEALYKNEQPRTVRRFAISNGSDMNVLAPLLDSNDRIVQWGKRKTYTHKHSLSSHIDSLKFNLSGGHQKQMIAFGADIDGMDSPSNYLYFGQNFMSNTLNFKKLWLTSKTGAYHAIITKRLCAMSFVSSATSDKVIHFIQKNTNFTLNRIQQNIVAKSSSLDKKSSYLNLIEAPGSSTNSAVSFERMPYSNLTSPQHTFIPSFSALNVGPNYAKTPFRGNLDIIPFHSYMSPGLLADVAAPNQEHIFTDETIINFTLQAFRGVHGTIGSQGVLKSYYNIAKEHNSHSAYHSHIYQLEVTKQAELAIGVASTVGNTSIPADVHQDIEVFLGNGFINGKLFVKGRLSIGDAQGSHSVLRINKGSRLVLEKGSSLFVGPGSKIIVEPGAEIVIMPQATLEWDNGTIEVNGEITCLQGADFSPSGSGTLIMAGSGRFSSQSSGSILLEDSQWIIHNLQHLSVYLKSIKLNNTEVIFANKGELKVRSSFELLNSTVRYIGLKQWGGLSISGTQASIEKTKFIGGDPALKVFSNASIALSKCDFSDAKKGLHCDEAPVDFYGNRFISCELGVHFKSDTTLIENNLFHDCDRGLIFHPSVKNTPIELKRNIFTSNRLAVEVHNSAARLECNDWKYNDTGYHQTGGTLHLGGGAGNTFQFNDLAVEFDEVTSLTLQKGSNQWMSNTTLDIKGAFSIGTAIPYNGSYYYVSADRNAFSNASSTDIRVGRDKVYPVTSNGSQSFSFLCPAKGPRKVGNSTEQPTDPSSFLIYPNPSKTSSVIAKFEEIQSWGYMEVFSASGRLVDHVELRAGITYKRLELPNKKGTYIVRLVTPLKTSTAKVVVLD